MRRFLALALSLGLAACAGAGATPTRWERSGVDDATTAKDESDCRATAQREAARRYPYGFGPPPYAAAYADASWLTWQRSVDADRVAAENRLTELCMRNKGYARTPIN
jgi:hypothetical protein